MVLRSVIGALVAIGVMGVVAAAWPERHAGKPPAQAPTFGTLNTPGAKAAAAAEGSVDERQTMLKLAAYPGPTTAPVTVAATAEPPHTAAPATPAPTAAPASTPTAPVVRTVAITQPGAADTTGTAGPSPPPATPSTSAAPAPQDAAARSPVPADRADGRININRASIAELDRIPGGGRIGASIARRRPYRSIDDLVKKRVLREAAFQRIRSAITTD